MKNNMNRFWIFLLLIIVINGNSFGQSLSLNGQDVTNQTINIAPNTPVTLIATLPSGATATYWTAVPGMSATTPAQAFPITAPAGNTVILTTPATTGDVDITVYFNTSPTVTSVWVKLSVNPVSIPLTLTTQQNVVGCQNITLNYSATATLLSNHTYLWEEWNGTSWVNLSTSNSYYNATGHILTVSLDNSILNKRFRCVVSITGCIGCSSTTSEVVVTTINALPTIFTYTTNSINYCPGNVPNLHLNSSQSGFTYQLQNYGTTTNVGAAIIGTGAPIDIPWPAGDYQILITNPATTCSTKL